MDVILFSDTNCSGSPPSACRPSLSRAPSRRTAYTQRRHRRRNPRTRSVAFRTAHVHDARSQAYPLTSKLLIHTLHGIILIYFAVIRFKYQTGIPLYLQAPTPPASAPLLSTAAEEFLGRGSTTSPTNNIVIAELPDYFSLKVFNTKGSAMMSLGEELKSSMPSFMQFCSRVDQGNVQEDWWTAGSDAEAFAHNNKEEWLSDSDSQNTIICSTTSSSPGPSLASTSTGGGQKAGLSKAKQGSRSKDTPAGQKPAQVVARRNARERRRVQAVNWAFARLRKVVPLEENKSKRMSKVKTLQMAIEYINQLQGVLSLQSPVMQQQQHNNHPEPEQHHQLLTTADINLFSDIQYKLEPGELQFRMPPNFYTQLLTDNQN